MYALCSNCLLSTERSFGRFAYEHLTVVIIIIIKPVGIYTPLPIILARSSFHPVWIYRYPRITSYSLSSFTTFYREMRAKLLPTILVYLRCLWLHRLSKAQAGSPRWNLEGGSSFLSVASLSFLFSQDSDD